VADGRLEMSEGGYRPLGDLTTLAIPDTLRSLIASRLDALEPADRALIQVAAVLGQSFTLDGLVATIGEDRESLSGRLATLVRRELLSLEADPRSPERGQYTFVQSLIREVAYATLSRRDRRDRHLAVARWYESLGDEELAGALASHYLEAHHESAPGPEADSVAVQARIALRAAAERASALGAHDQAISHLRQALDVTSDAAEQADLLLRAARSADLASRLTEAVEFAERGVSACEAAGDPASATRARAMLGAILLDAARIVEARTVLEATLSDLDETVDAAVRAEVLSNLSRALMRSDEAARAIEMADRALAIAERLDLELIVAEAFNNKGSSLGYVGRRREAVALLEAAIRVAQAGGFVGAELRALANLGSIVSGDDRRRAREVDREGLALARRVGHRMMANWLVGNVLIDAFAACEGWDLGVAEGEEALAAVTDPSDEQRITAFVTLIRICRGEPTDAAIARIGELLRATSDPGDEQTMRVLRALRDSLSGELGRAYDEAMGAVDLFSAFAQPCLRIAGRVALWGGDLERTRAVAERAGRLPDTGPSMHLLRTGLTAGIAALEGRRAEAIHGYRTVVSEALERGEGFEAANEALTAVTLLGTGDPALQALADEVRRLFGRVGAASYLARLDAAIAGPPVAAASGLAAGRDEGRAVGTPARRESVDPAPAVG